ncbi:MAG: hypothetical protein KBD24_00640 [Candidatus Pacebacteria bacterium]|nr:hypothetical protein [Candidatus Paceibacterota bacterium]
MSNERTVTYADCKTTTNSSEMNWSDIQNIKRMLVKVLQQEHGIVVNPGNVTILNITPLGD